MISNNERIKAVTQAIEYMKKHIDRELTSEELASVVGYSPFHFSRMFKEITGVSPRHYLSALRIEKGKAILFEPSSSILKTVLTIGFRSFGTFSTKFKQFVGLSPKQFQMSAKELYQFMNDYENEEVHKVEDMTPPVLTFHLEVPEKFKGLLFIGLFTKPIPDHRPVVGTAIRSYEKKCVFHKIPPGTYYALVASIPLSLNPKDYFLLDQVLRGKSEHPILVSDHSIEEIHIKIRPPLPYDPPILINLPRLLLEKVKNAN